ncbi:MAG TPA: CRISPR-associated endonuclease Cas2, partial [bacterium]|nr:CRISPR-associated endonuclease Cas2 [bacterium]
MKNKNRLILYDIRDPKRLLRVAKIMENYGYRVQKSVFEVICDDNT